MEQERGHVFVLDPDDIQTRKVIQAIEDAGGKVVSTVDGKEKRGIYFMLAPGILSNLARRLARPLRPVSVTRKR